MKTLVDRITKNNDVDKIRSLRGINEIIKPDNNEENYIEMLAKHITERPQK